ncbi:MAG: phosphatase PAP2 family protein [Candidatus Thioglobus sp.]|nr:phosphatase PAP2 family protein [Candidatus Thioglobus sp.]
MKDSSSESFPGDHATVLLTWLGYCLFFRRNRWSWAAAFLVIFFSLPRLIAGAHWLSDVLVGGLAIALVALAFGLFTPVLNRINQIFNTIANYFFSHFIKTFIKPFIKQK